MSEVVSCGPNNGVRDKPLQFPARPQQAPPIAEILKQLHSLKAHCLAEGKAFFNKESSTITSFVSTELRVSFPKLQQADVDNISQNVLLKVWTRIDQLEVEQSAKGWLTTVVKHQALDYMRASKRMAAHACSLQDGDGQRVVDLSDSRERSPAELAESKDEHSHMLNFVSVLSEEQRSLVLLRAEGLTYKEIEKVVGTPITTIKARLHGARQLLRATLGQEYEPRTRL
jgi:RNA polymerase sigma-70 factor (ECF subfamily)